jgi:hypothetical protein
MATTAPDTTAIIIMFVGSIVVSKTIKTIKDIKASIKS